MFVYTLDLSLSNTGCCIFSKDGKLMEMFSISTKSKDSHGKRLEKIYNTLRDYTHSYPVEQVVLENGFSRFNKATQALYKVHGVVNLLFCDYAQHYYSPKFVKKEITGNGNSKKEELQEIMLKIFENINFEDNDQSDAFAIGLCYFREKNIKVKI